LNLSTLSLSFPINGIDDECTQPSNHKQQWQLVLGNMQVIDRKGAAEWHHHKKPPHR